MSDFDEFVSLYTRFRVAAQYNGHLWHRLEERVKVNGGVMPCHKILLLREVRSRIQDASNAEKSVDDLIDEVIDQADRYRPPDTSGMVRHVVECPWRPLDPKCVPGRPHPAKRCKVPNLAVAEADCRKGFCRGIEVLDDLLEMVDVRSIAISQIRRFFNRRGGDITSPPRPEVLAPQILNHPVFIEGCLSPATLSRLDFLLLVLTTQHADPTDIELVEIVKLIRKPSSKTEKMKVTLSGRFGSIILGILEMYYGRKPPKNGKDKTGEKEKEKAGDDISDEVREVTRPVIEKAVTDLGPEIVDCWDRVEFLLGCSKQEHQAALRYFVQRVFDDCAEDSEVHEELVEKFGFSLHQAKTICQEFRERLVYRGDS